MCESMDRESSKLAASRIHWRKREIRARAIELSRESYNQENNDEEARDMCRRIVTYCKHTNPVIHDLIYGDMTSEERNTLLNYAIYCMARAERLLAVVEAQYEQEKEDDA